MKRIVLLIVVISLASGCVSKKVYQELESKYNRLRSANATLVKEKEDQLTAKKNLEDQYATLNKKFEQLSTERQQLETDKNSLEAKLSKLQESYDVLSSQSSKKIAEEAAINKDLLMPVSYTHLTLPTTSRV